MGLFFDVLSAINNPNQQANVEQLGSLVNSVQQLSQQTGLDMGTTQNVISALGSAIRPVLQEQSSAMGGQQFAKVLSQLGGGGKLGGLMGAAGGAGMLQALIPAQMQQQLAQTVAQKTGLDAAMIQSLIPTLIPIAINFLNMGANKPGTPGGANPLLSAFLDGDRDGDTDLGDVMKFASRFMNPPN
ncbi:MAG TPA: DUF937 domain-containing protein [Coleofasciculaceae cyanobacterium]